MKQFLGKVLYFLRSMRIQVLIVFLMMGLVPLYIFSIIITNAYESKLVSQRVDELQSYGTMISNLVVSSGYLVDHDSEEVVEEAAQIAEIYQGRIILVDQNLRIIHDTYGLEDGKTVISTEVVKCFNSDNGKYINELGEYVQLTMPIANSNNRWCRHHELFHEKSSSDGRCRQTSGIHYPVDINHSGNSGCFGLLHPSGTPIKADYILNQRNISGGYECKA